MTGLTTAEKKGSFWDKMRFLDSKKNVPFLTRRIIKSNTVNGYEILGTFFNESNRVKHYFFLNNW
jgi:hypothetical protein